MTNEVLTGAAAIIRSLEMLGIEHVFGCMTMSMGGKMTRKIGLARTETWWGLKNLAYNFLRYLQRTSSLGAAASH